ncbi:hypothetical protein SPRG_14446 [Saprolegnia parasitica CBS 223.65]|uniref:Uncharacterized protein n=1 Tax=Saprolegnia parasitica (strain CBS 223.65) TaxID=695850 RepID=A0A067C184_SAPPC|nr:hypothetical protein SPRG_14446 [Saprolegnia parasitica CBS 223.65]KDO20311.1 hypothetical protein SPRG_14446 [Saprolegnia parasitica CBS 223.65]|eukprot:XP_012208980.1 hypothetical protein SPRG_14446 [Saprolegnia parasitica CBS 223.65]
MTKAMAGKGKAAVKAPPGASVDIEVLQKLQTAIGQPIKVNMIQDALKVIGRRKFDGETDESDDEDRPTAMQAATDRQATADPGAQRSTSQSATSNLAIKIAQTADDLVAAFKERTEWNRLLKIFSVNDPAAKVAVLRRKINRHLQRE